MAGFLKSQRIEPQWVAEVHSFHPDDPHSWLLIVRNEGPMVGSFVPVAMEADVRVDMKRLSLRALPGSGSSALINPGDSIRFELIAEPARRFLAADESYSISLLYPGITFQDTDYPGSDWSPETRVLSVRLAR